MNIKTFAITCTFLLVRLGATSSTAVELTVAPHGASNTNSGTFMASAVEHPQDAAVASVDIDSLKPSQEHHSPETDIVEDVAVAVGGRQRENRRLAYVAPTSCPNDEYVLYDNGVATTGTCGTDDCCVGTSACTGFSGCVKKDGSCNGFGACYNLQANIVEGSCKGFNACAYFGTAKNIRNSCTNGSFVCRSFAGNGGQVGDLTNSCNDGDYACYNFAYGGQVGNLNDSCNNRYQMCHSFARENGHVGDVTSSCTDSTLSCYALFQGKVNGTDIVNYNLLASSPKAPTKSPTTPPSIATTTSPTTPPSSAPTSSPTSKPTTSPSEAPVFTRAPTTSPNNPPSIAPTTSPTTPPSSAPTSSPTSMPTTSSSKTPVSTRADLPFSWDIQSSEMMIAFGDDSLDDEVRIPYNISNKDFNVTIMTENCTFEVSTDIISVSTTNVSSPTHILLNVSADINLTAVAGSAVWTNPATANSDLAYIDFCIRLDLWHEGTSMNFLERDISLQLNMTSESFNVTSSNLNRTEGQAVDEEVDAAYVVEACQCTALLQCVNTPEEKTLTQGDSLYLCLKANTAEVIVSDIKTLTISQTGSGGGVVTQNPVAAGQTSALTLVAPINNATNENELNIRTQLFSVFFGQDPAPLVVSGVAQLAFKNGRKLLAEVVDVRNLQQETQDPLSAQFNIAVNLKSNAKEENVFSDGTRAGVSYAFPVICFVVVVLLPIMATNCM